MHIGRRPDCKVRGLNMLAHWQLDKGGSASSRLQRSCQHTNICPGNKPHSLSKGLGSGLEEFHRCQSFQMMSSHWRRLIWSNHHSHRKEHKHTCRFCKLRGESTYLGRSHRWSNHRLHSLLRTGKDDPHRFRDPSNRSHRQLKRAQQGWRMPPHPIQMRKCKHPDCTHRVRSSHLCMGSHESNHFPSTSLHKCSDHSRRHHALNSH